MEVSFTAPHGLPLVTGEPFFRAVLALQLCEYNLYGEKYEIHAKPRWLWSAQQVRSITFPFHTEEPVIISSEELREVMRTYEHISRFSFQTPRSEHDLAIHRFALGARREDSADAILDFTIALESLLLPYDEDARRGDLGYRFRMHGAHYLESSPDQRKLTLKKLGKIYEVRSRLVHGGKYPSQETIIETRTDAYDLARRGLLRAIREGFPRPETFKAMLLG